MSERDIHTAIEMHGHGRAPAGGSDRAFGLVFGAFFAVVGFYPLLKGSPPRWWALGVGALFVLVALLRAQALAPLNWLWTRLGLLLNRIVSPVALLLVYCLAIVPTGLLLRAMGKDPLRLRADPAARTYWIERAPPGRADEQMKKQF